MATSQIKIISYPKWGGFMKQHFFLKVYKFHHGVLQIIYIDIFEIKLETIKEKNIQIDNCL